MYAEIKDEKRILINRLADSEKILLQQIANNSKNAEISFSELTGETGDFDGVMVNVNPIEPKIIEPEEAIMSELTPLKNEPLRYEFTVSEDANILIKYNDYENMCISSNKNVIEILAKDLITDTLKYEIMIEGYEPLYGEINIVVKERTAAIVTVETDPEEVDCIMILDENSTIIDAEQDGTYLLPIGQYKLKVSKMDYKQYEEDFEITQEDLENITKEIIATLTPIED